MAARRLRSAACIVACIAALLIAAPGAQTQEPAVGTDRGVVQTVAAQQLVVRALDGSSLEFTVDGSTRVVVNGVRTRLGAIRPGFVAEVVHVASGRAVRIRAFGQITGTEQGVIVSAIRGELRLQRLDGTEVAIPLTRRTRVRRGGVLVGRWALRAGRRAIVTLAPSGSARLVLLGRKRP